MGFDKEYPNRKDHRKPYRRRGKYDRSCRCHGGCPHCEGSRLHSTKKREPLKEEDADGVETTTE